MILINNNNLKSKRDQIMEAAITVFSKKGFHESKVEEIAEVACVGKGTVYKYFDSKNFLFQEMLIYIIDNYRCRMKAHVEQADTFVEKIKALVENHFSFLNNHKEMGKLIIADAPPISEELHLAMRQKQQIIVNDIVVIIEEAIQKGEIRYINSKTIAPVIMGIITAVGGNMVEDEQIIDHKEIIESLLDFILKGVEIKN